MPPPRPSCLAPPRPSCLAPPRPTYLNVDGAVLRLLGLEVGRGGGLVKGQRLPRIHQYHVTQHNAHRVLAVGHARVAAGGGVGWRGGWQLGFECGQHTQVSMRRSGQPPAAAAGQLRQASRPPRPAPAPASPAHPAAAAMRPQLGSPPKMALLARLDPTTDLATWAARRGARQRGGGPTGGAHTRSEQPAAGPAILTPIPGPATEQSPPPHLVGRRLVRCAQHLALDQHGGALAVPRD